MGKRLWDLAKSRFEIGTFSLLAHRHKVYTCREARAVLKISAEIRRHVVSAEIIWATWTQTRILMCGRSS